MPKSGGSKSKKGKKKAKPKALALPPPKTIQERSREYIDPEVTTVPADACKVGSNARSIKPTGVNMIKESIKESGYARESIIQVIQGKEDGEYLVIDGMHRVSALNELLLEGHPDVDFEKVNKFTHKRVCVYGCVFVWVYVYGVCVCACVSAHTHSRTVTHDDNVTTRVRRYLPSFTVATYR